MNNRPTNSMWMTGLFLSAIMSGYAPALGQQRETSVTPDAGLAALVNSANDVVLVHILTDSCQIPKVEPAPTTKCEGLILLSWKGLKDSDSIAFSIASGGVRLPGNIPSISSSQPIRPFQAGGRYLLSLRYAKDWEGRPPWERPLNADEVQAALEFKDTGDVQPVLALNSMSGRLHRMIDHDVLDDLEGITHRGSMNQRYADQKMEVDYCCILSSQRLEDAGIHLPAYLPSVIEQGRYQAVLNNHQELTVEWESLPGVRGTGEDGVVVADKFKGIPFAPNFAILDRKQSLSGHPPRPDSIGFGHDYVFAAVTSNGEIRGLTTPGISNMNCPDLPPPPGSNQEGGTCFIFPKVKFSVTLPDDPKIRTIIILGVRSDDKGYHFKPFGRMELLATEGAR